MCLSRRESNAIWFKATDFRVCCVKILVNPKGKAEKYCCDNLSVSACYKEQWFKSFDKLQAEIALPICAFGVARFALVFCAFGKS